MKRYTVFLLAAFMGLALAIPVGPSRTAFATGSYYWDFETTTALWPVFADSGVDHFGRARDLGNACPRTGTASEKLYIDEPVNYGRGAIWMEQQFNDTGSLTVSVSWKARGVTLSASGMLSRGYIGTTPPNGGSNFTTVGDPISYNFWNSYTYTQSIASDGAIYVDIGYKSALDDYDARAVDYDCISVDTTANSR